MGTTKTKGKKCSKSSIGGDHTAGASMRFLRTAEQIHKDPVEGARECSRKSGIRYSKPCMSLD